MVVCTKPVSYRIDEGENLKWEEHGPRHIPDVPVHYGRRYMASSIEQRNPRETAQGNLCQSPQMLGFLFLLSWARLSLRSTNHIRGRCIPPMLFWKGRCRIRRTGGGGYLGNDTRSARILC